MNFDKKEIIEFEHNITMFKLLKNKKDNIIYQFDLLIKKTSREFTYLSARYYPNFNIVNCKGNIINLN